MNRLVATVVSIQKKDSLYLIDSLCNEQKVQLMALEPVEGLKTGSVVHLSIKPTCILISKSLDTIHSGNRLFANIKSIDEGQLVARVVLIVGSMEIESLLPKEYIKELELNISKRVELIIPQSAIAIEDIVL